MNHILIVDDKTENLYLLRMLLQGHGYAVDEASHGAEALDKAHQTLPQLIISDLLMPVMDGYTLLRHWKADEQLKSIPFVVYTATYTDPQDERLALDLGAEAFILKPADPEAFVDRIRQVLARTDHDGPPQPYEPRVAEHGLFREYSEVLVRKLEVKTLQLEQTNRALLEDIAARKQAEAAVQRSADRLRALADASHAFAEVGTAYQTLLDQVARTAGEVLRAGCTIGQLSEDGVWLQLAALYAVDPAQYNLLGMLALDEPRRLSDPSFGGRIIQTGQPILIDVVEPSQVHAMAKPEYWSLMDELNLHSMLGAPMRVHGQTVGIMTVFRSGHSQPSFTKDDLELAQDLADRAALAISNARLLAQVQHELAERARAEDAVRLLNAELEQRVVARTAELTAANKELEAFSYSVSHDLRAPLRAIDGFTRILLEEYVAILPNEAQRYFQLVRDNAQKMGHLIDDLLAFARLSRQPINKREVAMGELVRQCLDELRAEQTGRHIDMQISDLPPCAGDPALLKQVWINLLTNALKYTRRRDPAAISIGSHAEGGETIYSIKDNGVGFDMRYSDKLFGVFQRLHRAEDYEGTGVGLATVQRIIHRHGGRVWAEAATDQGAAFFFTLGESTNERESDRDPAGGG